nr:hypothetical protein [Tanacetum cinerariifolium]
MFKWRTRIAQSLVLPPVADEPASLLKDVSQGEAYPTDSGFIVDQDRANIAKSSTLPQDSAPRVTSPAVDEGTQELEINRLKVKVKLLEDREGVAVERSGDDALIKGRNLDEGEAAAERVSDDTEEMTTFLTSMDAATVLASGVTGVPTSSGSIPTASPPAAEVPTSSDVVPTASLVFATATMIDAHVARELEEQLEREDQRMSEQITRDAEVARIHVEEELQSMIDGLDRSNETIAKYQDNYAMVYKFQTQQRKPWSKNQKRDYYMAVIRSNLGWKVKDFRGMSFEEIEAKFTIVWKQLEDFIPMGSKEETERLKRKGLSLEQESAKKLKSSDEVFKEVKSPDEVPKEKHMDKEDLNQLWDLVKESLSNRQPTSDKEMELWVELKRNFHACGEGLPTKEGSGTYDDLGRIVGNKMHKAFPLLAEEVPTASEESSYCQKKRDATAKRIALLVKVKE